MANTARTGLAARLYQDAEGKWRPLQYTLLDVNPVVGSSVPGWRAARRRCPSPFGRECFCH